MKRFSAILAIAILVSSCGTGSENIASKSESRTFPKTVWERGKIPAFVDPESLRQRIDPELQLYADAPAVQSAVIVYRGRIIYEKYAPVVSQASIARSFSIAKSFLFAAVGIAIEKGIMSLTDTHLYGGWSKSDTRSRISVEHLLHMESGLEWEEDWDTGDPLVLLKNPNGAAAFAAEKKLIHEPGSHFNYSTGNSAILAAYLTQKLGGTQNLQRFMKEELFQPIGITSTTLTLDKTGVWVGGVGANSTPRDFARFGWLFANDGKWENTQIIPAQWVKFAGESTATTSEYGAHWWTLEPDTISALGIYGQAIVVNRKLETVVVVTSMPGSEQDRGFSLALNLVREISPTANVG